jgi:hypothetical protein
MMNTTGDIFTIAYCGFMMPLLARFAPIPGPADNRRFWSCDIHRQTQQTAFIIEVYNSFSRTKAVVVQPESRFSMKDCAGHRYPRGTTETMFFFQCFDYRVESERRSLKLGSLIFILSSAPPARLPSARNGSRPASLQSRQRFRR